jgi:peptidoglycan hydrolase-like protein with peptidoglycan-binding domain
MWSDVQNIYPYKETIELSDPDMGDDGNLYYKTENGYVLGTDVFNVDNVHSTVELPTLKYNDSSAYVTKVQEAINDIYGTAIHSGKMDNLTMDYIRALQGSYDLPKTGIVDNDTWIALQTASGKTNIVSNDDVEVTFSMSPGVYDSEDIKDAIKALEVSVKTENGINVKTVATSKYSDNTFNYNENLEEVVGSKTLDKTNLSNATLYNAYKGELPQAIEYTVYPYNMDPYKWVFKSKGA